MSVCPRPAERLFHNLGPVSTPAAAKHRSPNLLTTSPRVNAADDDLHHTTADSQRSGKLQLCRTTNGGPRWLSWSPPTSEKEPGELVYSTGVMWSYRRTLDMRRALLQQHSGQTAAGSSIHRICIEKWVAVVQATWNERLDQHLHGIRWHGSDVWS